MPSCVNRMCGAVRILSNLVCRSGESVNVVKTVKTCPITMCAVFWMSFATPAKVRLSVFEKGPVRGVHSDMISFVCI